MKKKRYCFIFVLLLMSVQNLAASITTLEFLENPGSFSLFVDEMKRIKFDQVFAKRGLTGSDNYTFFAPTNEAIQKFGLLGLVRKVQSNGLISEKDRKKLEKFIKFHVIKNKFTKQSINRKKRLKAKSLSGASFAFKNIKQNDIRYSISTANGIIHVVDTVFIHPDLEALFGKKRE